MNENMHQPIERKVYVTEVDAEDGYVDYVEEYRTVCVVCVPKYSGYRPWPCEYADASDSEAGTGVRPEIRRERVQRDENGCPDEPHHGVDCPGDACRFAA